MTIYARNIYGGSSTRVGDQHRTATFSLTATVESTVLNLSTTSGRVKYIQFFPSGASNLPALSQSTAVNSSSVDLTNMKFTIDGAAERTFTYGESIEATHFETINPGTTGEQFSVGVSQSNYLFPVDIGFSDSMVIKLTTSKAINGVVVYDVD